MSRRDGKAAKWILLGCGGAFFLGVLMVGGCLALILQATKPAVETTERFLTAMAGGDAAGAKKEVAPGLASSVDAALAASKPVWGKDWTVAGRSVNSSNGRTTGEISVALKGADGTSRTVVISLTGDPDWKVVAVKVDSKQILPAVAAEGIRISNPSFNVSGGAAEGWKVTFSLEAHGLVQSADGKLSVVEGVTITGPKGNVLFQNDEFKVLEDKGDMATFTNEFTIPATGGPGKHVFAFVVRDRITKEDARWSQELDLK